MDPPLSLDGPPIVLGGVILCLDISGDALVAGSDDRQLRLFELQDGCWKPTGALRGHSGAIYCCRFAVDGSGTVASGSHDRAVKLWWKKRCFATLLFDAPVRCLAFHGELLWAGSDGTLQLWDSGSARRLSTVPHTLATVRGVAVLRDWTAVATDAGLRVWDGTGERMLEPAAAGGIAYCCAFRGDGILFAGHADGVISIVEAPSWHSKGCCDAGLGKCMSLVVACDEASSLLASGYGDGSVVTWTVRHAQLLVHC